ncbi:hypothetical protein ELE36_03160 [Pseudolysobacter antarcticus]|uniref:Uncharacterized protein n=1 Tax=Pseudolysobacter antarcticus TaxID=2511995 RepID=A0A411HG29_9GAMM|nr:hypothetical protein [Pseudolysobacter antarcticus]QBB69453.1 hypothetical protein ELE36_03160 [Pseudolysobacter antarcticus]
MDKITISVPGFDAVTQGEQIKAHCGRAGSSERYSGGGISCRSDRYLFRVTAVYIYSLSAQMRASISAWHALPSPSSLADTSLRRFRVKIDCLLSKIAFS